MVETPGEKMTPLRLSDHFNDTIAGVREKMEEQQELVIHLLCLLQVGLILAMLVL